MLSGGLGRDGGLASHMVAPAHALIALTKRFSCVSGHVWEKRNLLRGAQHAIVLP